MADEGAALAAHVRDLCARLGLGSRVVVTPGNSRGRFVLHVDEGGWGFSTSGSWDACALEAARMLGRELGSVLERAGPEVRTRYDEAMRARKREGAR